MPATVTKSFEFSASHSAAGKVFGHNYILHAAFHVHNASEETGLSEKIERSLIQKMHSRDLGSDVEFLKNVPPDDLSRLKVFWEIIARETRPARLESLCLERNRHTRWTLTADSSR